MKNKLLQFVLIIALTFSTALPLAAHCEIPCGIYDDQMRIALISEHIQTIEKSINQIKELERQPSRNYNQIVRWVVNKETHAAEIQKIVSQYFLTQRIKPDAKNYIQNVTLLHKMLLSAMKCKQTVDPAHTNRLRALLEEFTKSYLH